MRKAAYLTLPFYLVGGACGVPAEPVVAVGSGGSSAGIGGTGGAEPGSGGSGGVELTALGGQGLGGELSPSLGGSGGSQPERGGAGGGLFSPEKICVAYCNVEAQTGCPKAPSLDDCRAKTCDGFPRAEECAMEYATLRSCLIELGPSAFTCLPDGRPINKPEPCPGSRARVAECVNR
ncbi:MAG: hypothetical protein SFV15_26990 [Polyangiaceae bacterium]|nr:hypothetical protein [Polyangiaceae bacterium]